MKAPERNRTADLRTTNAVLYQLSYKSRYMIIMRFNTISKTETLVKGRDARF